MSLAILGIGTAVPPWLSVEKVIHDLWIEDSPLGRPVETPPSRARLAFPRSTRIASSDAALYPQSVSAVAGRGRRSLRGAGLWPQV